MKWIKIKDKLPDENQTVWACNPVTEHIDLACLIYEDDGWLWAISNGFIYSKDGKIVSELIHYEYYDFTHWMELPDLPKK